MAEAESNGNTEATAAPAADAAAVRVRRAEVWYQAWRRPGRLLALAAAVIAVSLAGLAWWQSGQIRQVRQELLASRQGLLGSFESTSGDLRQLAGTIDEFERALAERDALLAGLGDDLDALAAEIAAVGRRVDGLQGGRLDARDSWLREQIEYYLVLANTELNLRGEVERAIAALELADDGLLELGDPRLGDVRRAIASGLQALHAVAQPDLEGIVLELGSLLARVPELPLRAAAPENYVADPAADDADEPGFGRLWDRTKGAVTSIVRIEREEEPVAPVLTESERRIARRQLGLELQIARAAVVDRRRADFRASLVAADAILNRDFDRAARSIVAARELLAGYLSVELAPPLPDISDSLILLRNASGDR